MTPASHPIVGHHDPIPAELQDPLCELGAKGMSLRKLAEAGFRIPHGFTIRASVGQQLLNKSESHELIWQAISRGIECLEQQTGRRFGGRADRRLLLAVRSGAAESMPGLLQTHLNIGAGYDSGDGPGIELREAINSVFRSWDSPAARAYRKARGIDDGLGTAVTVQEQIDCITAGVFFTNSPDDDHSDDFLVEAVVGSGEKLVSGTSIPCRWRITREQQIVDAPEFVVKTAEDLAALQKLSEQLPSLIDKAVQLERAFGHSLDIEWGLDSNGFVFFQARKIDAFTRPEDRNNQRQTDFDRLRRLASDGTRIWVRHNLGETLPHPTPLTWSLWKQFMSGRGGIATLYRQLGYSPDPDGGEFLTLIGGRIYADADRAARLFGRHYPFRYDRDALRRNPAALNHAPTHFDPTKCDPWLLWKLPVLGWHAVRRSHKIRTLMSSAGVHFNEITAPNFLREVDRLREDAMNEADHNQIAVRLDSCRRLVFDEFGAQSLLPGTVGLLAYNELLSQLKLVLGESAAAQLVVRITPSGDTALMHRQQQLLARVHADDDVAPFLDEFGHRTVGEMDLANPRWRETPDAVRTMAARVTTLVGPPDEDCCVDQSNAQQHLQHAFENAGARSLMGKASIMLDHCWELLPFRDRGKHVFLHGYELLRELVEAAARRTGLAEEAHFVSFDELLDVLRGGSIPGDLTQRCHNWQQAESTDWPEVIVSDDRDSYLVRNAVADSDSQYSGETLAAGQATGVGVSLEELRRQDSLPANAVLICETLEPSLAVWLNRISGVVVELGGQLSHGAILARQFNIPVIRIPGAIRLFHAGQRISIDGRTGQVTVVDKEPS